MRRTPFLVVGLVGTAFLGARADDASACTLEVPAYPGSASFFRPTSGSTVPSDPVIEFVADTSTDAPTIVASGPTGRLPFRVERTERSEGTVWRIAIKVDRGPLSIEIEGHRSGAFAVDPDAPRSTIVLAPPPSIEAAPRPTAARAVVPSPLAIDSLALADAIAWYGLGLALGALAMSLHALRRRH